MSAVRIDISHMQCANGCVTTVEVDGRKAYVSDVPPAVEQSRIEKLLELLDVENIEFRVITR